MTATPRERARTQTMADIVAIGREHLALHGAASLSLRAVARDLGVVSSAVYRYVKSRDELLTLLVVDGYNQLGDEVDAAVAAASRASFRAQFRAIGFAVRAWALRQPATYALLFGSPVPGYDAPAEQTTGPGTRVIVALVRLYERAHTSGGLHVDDSAPATGELAVDFASIRADFDLTVPDEVIARGLLCWAAVFGAVSFEVFGQYGADTFGDPAGLFEYHLEVLADTVGLPADRRTT